MADSETTTIIIVLCSVLGFFLIVFALLFWYFKFYRPPTSGSLRARPRGGSSPSASFNARMANFNNSLNNKQETDKEMEDGGGTQEFGTIRQHNRADWGVDIPGGTAGPNGTRSFMRGWFGLDAGSGTGYNTGPLPEGNNSINSQTSRHIPLASDAGAEDQLPLSQNKVPSAADRRDSTDTWDGN
ncbi:hypothetical protein BT69DRAFT_1278229 [Atractiella rhizophila]|nr:hypothetical protein BT69DRAFT_1278229 [Atractiella rhizophila]